jgi:hypothetical protein
MDNDSAQIYSTDRTTFIPLAHNDYRQCSEAGTRDQRFGNIACLIDECIKPPGCARLITQYDNLQKSTTEVKGNLSGIYGYAKSLTDRDFRQFFTRTRCDFRKNLRLKALAFE